MRVLVSAATLSLFLVAIGCGPTTPPPKADGGKPPVDKEKGDKPPVEKGMEGEPDTKKLGTPAFKLTAEAYSTEWEKDKAGAEAKYTGKVVELSGVVKLITWGSVADSPVLAFAVPDEILPTIHCLLRANKQILLKVSKGSKVTLRGHVYRGRGGTLDSCEFTSIGPNLAIAIASEALAAEYGKDREGTLAKYKGKILNLTGVIIGKSKEGDFLKLLFERERGDQGPLLFRLRHRRYGRAVTSRTVHHHRGRVQGLRADGKGVALRWLESSAC